jgi:hypothetical protein
VISLIASPVITQRQRTPVDGHSQLTLSQPRWIALLLTPGTKKPISAGLDITKNEDLARHSFYLKRIRQGRIIPSLAYLTDS